MGQNESQLDSEAISELSGETVFVDDELKQAYIGFMNDYPDGKMTADQLKEVYKKLSPKSDPSDFVEYVFRSFDSNGDGTIDFKEFIIALSVTRRGGSTKKKLQWIFSVYDLDSNGFITKNEMTEVLASIYKMSKKPMGYSANKDLSPEQRVEKIYDLMDKDGDENLSLNEFADGMKNDPSVEALISFSLTDSHTYF